MNLLFRLTLIIFSIVSLFLNERIYGQTESPSETNQKASVINNGATENLVMGEARYLAKNEENQEDVKKQLLYLTIVDVITKELKSMELDANLFWKRFNEKFELEFVAQKEELKKKFLNMENDPKEKNEFDKTWLLKQRELKLSFERMQQVLSSYSVTRFNRSPQNQQLRFMSIQAQTDKEFLTQLYRKMTTDTPIKGKDILYLQPRFVLQSTDWTELGVEGESDFTKVVNEHWVQFLTSNLKGEISSTQVADNSVVAQLEESLKQLDNDNLPSGIGIYAGSLLLKINIVIKKTEENAISSTRNFEISGDYILRDLATGLIIDGQDFSMSKNKYQTRDKHAFSSSLASYIYKMPIENWNELKKLVGNMAPNLRRANLLVNNVSNIDDLIKLKSLLISKGITKQLRSDMATYEGKNAKLAIYYSGEMEEFSKFLSSLDKWRLTERKIVHLKTQTPPFVLELKDSAIPANANGGR